MMAEPEQGGAAAFIRDAPLRVVLEIARRLPARSVLRLRGVCRGWRMVTSHPAFLAVLHRLQPPQPLLCFGRAACPDRYIQLRDYCVEALDLRSDKLRSIFRFTDSTYFDYENLLDGDEVAPINDFAVDYDDYEEYDDECFMPRLTVHASLDGLLLVSFINAWYVCNPATRQWAALADLSDCDVVGFYEHVSSGEYRVLYLTGKDDEDVSTCFYVLKVGSRMSRIIGCPISPAAAEDMGLDIGLEPSSLSPPVQLRCTLHWPPQERQGYHILVFDTEAELFSWMSPPVKDKDMRLLEIEGKLAMSVSSLNKATLELWRLEDYQNEIWVQMFRIRLAVAQMPDLNFEDWSSSVVSPAGDVLIECPYRVLHCDRNGNLLQRFRFPEEAAPARHALRESLLPHAIFLAPKWRGASEPRFYSGLYRKPRWRVPEPSLENISPRHELWNLHWPQPPTTRNKAPYLRRYFFGTPYSSSSRRNKSFCSSNPSHPRFPSQFDAAVASRASFAVTASRLRRRRPGVPAVSHGRRRRGRIRQCLWRRRRRVWVLLLRAARRPQECLRHGHTRRVPEARVEVAPGPVGERPRRHRRGQAAVPADPGGVFRFVGQGEEGHVRRRAVRSPRRRRPGFLRLHAGDAGDDG